MTVSSEERIRAILYEDVARMIAEYCITPRSSADVIKYVFREKSGLERRTWERVVSENLRALEQNGAITYTIGKWKTAEITKNVLAKYFGL